MITNENIKGGYRVYYYDNHNDTQPKVLHEPLTSKSNKLSAGKINKVLNTADEFTFIITMQNTYYQKLKPIVGLVKVINLFDNSIEFYGRILEISGEMDSGGIFHQEIVCESHLGFLNDMTLMYEKRPNKGPEEYLRHVIDFHNARVEPHKRFKVGNITVPNKTDSPYLYCTYETTWECIKERLVAKFGGYLIMRSEKDGNYIDYLESIGEHKKSPIQLGKNIKSSSRNVSLADMMTQIVPIGGDLDKGSTETGSDVVREQVNIGPAMGGPLYLSDNALIKEFGVIRKIVVWSEITDSNVLKARGQQYLDNQRVALANWKVSVVDRALIDNNYEKFELGNYHPIVNAPLSGIEELQIIEKEIDIIRPQAVELTIGADRLTLSSFQLQQQAAQKSMEKVMADRDAQNNLSNSIALLKTELSQYQSFSDSYGVEIQSLTNQINGLDPSSDQALIDSLTVQKQVATDKKAYYDQLIVSVKQQITDLGGTV